MHIAVHMRIMRWCQVEGVVHLHDWDWACRLNKKVCIIRESEDHVKWPAIHDTFLSKRKCLEKGISILFDA
jgi:hypothetical protein